MRTGIPQSPSPLTPCIPRRICPGRSRECRRYTRRPSSVLTRRRRGRVGRIGSGHALVSDSSIVRRRHLGEVGLGGSNLERGDVGSSDALGGVGAAVAI